VVYEVEHVNTRRRQLLLLPTPISSRILLMSLHIMNTWHNISSNIIVVDVAVAVVLGGERRIRIKRMVISPNGRDLIRIRKGRTSLMEDRAERRTTSLAEGTDLTRRTRMARRTSQIR